MLILLTFALHVASAHPTNPVPDWYMSLRSSEKFLLDYCKIKNCTDHILKTVSKEFSNENTYVRLISRVAGKNITILIPAKMNSNDLMELLIKIRTSKQNFSNTIHVITSSKTGELSVQNDSNAGDTLFNEHSIVDLLSVAGADSFNGILINKKIPSSNRSQHNLQQSIVVDTGSHPDLAKMIAENLKVPYSKSSEQILQENVSTAIVVAAPVSPVNLNIFKTINELIRLSRKDIKTILVSPYLPYARSDKVDHEGVTITGRLIADLYEYFGLTAIHFVRAHAPQSQGFFSIPSIQTMGRETINQYLLSQNVEQIISPDAGFQKDATLYADELKLPISVVNKQRDLLTGDSKIHDMSGPSVKGKTVAIIDDETASGGTLAKVAQFLKQQGAKKVIAVVTHLAGDAAQAINSPDIDSIATTDTLPFSVVQQDTKIVKLRIAEELTRDLITHIPGRIIRCHQLFTKE